MSARHFMTTRALPFNGVFFQKVLGYPSMERELTVIEVSGGESKQVFIIIFWHITIAGIPVFAAVAIQTGLIWKWWISGTMWFTIGVVTADMPVKVVVTTWSITTINQGLQPEQVCKLASSHQMLMTAQIHNRQEFGVFFMLPVTI